MQMKCIKGLNEKYHSILLLKYLRHFCNNKFSLLKLLSDLLQKQYIRISDYDRKEINFITFIYSLIIAIITVKEKYEYLNKYHLWPFQSLLPIIQ